MKEYQKSVDKGDGHFNIDGLMDVMVRSYKSLEEEEEAILSGCAVLQCAACVAVCCSVLQCVAVCCSVLQCAACVAVCCSVLQCVAVCCSVLLMDVFVRSCKSLAEEEEAIPSGVAALCSVLQRCAVCCSVVQCVAEPVALVG